MEDDINKLIEILGGDDPVCSAEAAEELSLLGPDAWEATVALVRAMANQDEEVREFVTEALEELGPPSPVHMPELAKLLEDPNADVGYWAATLLGRLGQLRKAAIAPLIKAAENPAIAITVRERVVWALGRIGRPAKAALPILGKYSRDTENSRLSRLAATAIKQMGAQ